MTVLARLGLLPEPEAAQPDGEVVTAVLAGSGALAGPDVEAGRRAPGAAPDAAAGGAAPEDIVAHLVQAGVRVRGFVVERESLEDRFVALTGEGFDVAQ
jgi:ABC-2 type transport system ATP-binding protein